MKGQKGRNSFALFIHDQMNDQDLTLREVARRSGIDVANLSRIERGMAYPPKKEEVLEKLANALEMSDDQKSEMVDLAKLINGKLVNELENVREIEAIPMLLRAVNNHKLGNEDIQKLVELIKDANTFKS